MDPEETKEPGYAAPEGEKSGQAGVDACAGIEDPIRRGLCRVCQAPVIGEAPFCKDHETPVP